MKIRVGRCWSAGESLNDSIIETENGVFPGQRFRFPEKILSL